MLKEYLCDNHSQWNNSLVAMETQSPVNDKEKRTMYPRQPPRVLQTSDLMNRTLFYGPSVINYP